MDRAGNIAPGRNIARSIHDEEARGALAELMEEGLAELPLETGAILRSAAAHADADLLLEELGSLSSLTQAILNADKADSPELLLDAPDVEGAALMSWATSPDVEIIAEQGAFERLDIWSALDGLRAPHVPLGKAGSMMVEPTTALVAIDVNTGQATGQGAGLAVNVAAAGAIPEQLRLRGLGGQVVIDFAPMGKKDRVRVETALKRALKADGIETSLAGWTPLGHLELNRKRERRPLKDLL